MTQPLDYYEVLGVERTASEPQILQAYRKLAVRYHPDLHPGNDAMVDRFKEVTEAFEVLSDTERRRRYDEEGRRRDEPETFEEQIAKKAAAQTPTRVAHGATFGDLFGSRENNSAPGKGAFGNMFGKKK